MPLTKEEQKMGGGIKEKSVLIICFCKDFGKVFKSEDLNL